MTIVKNIANAYVYMELVVKKRVFRVSHKVSFKPATSRKKFTCSKGPRTVLMKDCP